VLRPLASDFLSTPRSSSSVMSRSAVSCEHFAMAAHLLLVSLLSNPSASLLSRLICRL
jgi:hypothetical protein